MGRPTRCRAAARALVVLSPFVLLLALSAPAGAAPPAKKPSPAPAGSPTPSPTASASPRPQRGNGNKHASPSAAPAAPTAGRAASPSPVATAPAPAPAATRPKGNKHRISPSPAPPRTTAAAAPVRPAFIGPVAPRSVRIPSPVAFIGPVATHHVTARHSTRHPQPRRTALAAPHPPAVGLVPGRAVVPTVHNIVRSSVSHPQAPVALACLVLLFLTVQHRIDRRDPKLDATPRGDDDVLEFGAAIRPA